MSERDHGLRVLLISLGYPKYPGDSTAPFMARIVDALAGRGHQVDVLLPHHPEFRYPVSPGVEFFDYRYSPIPGYAPWGFGGSLKGSSRIRAAVVPLLPSVVLSLHRRVGRLLRSRPYDLVHAHWLVPNGWAAYGPARQRDVPLVVTLHGSDVSLSERVSVLRHLAGRTLAGAGAVTAVSENLAARALALGASPATTKVVHLGIDTDLFAPRPPDPAMRRRLGAAPGETLVLAVGRLIEVKGFDVLLESAARVERAHLAIVGDGDLRSDLERRASALGLDVTFAGNLEQSEVSEALTAADIVAVPSVVGSAGTVEGLPTTLLEAAAAGRPIVASNLAGIPDVITDGDNGLLVRERDVVGLADALCRLRDDAPLRDELGRAARATAVSRFDWKAAGAAFEEVYLDVLRRHAD